MTYRDVCIGRQQAIAKQVRTSKLALDEERSDGFSFKLWRGSHGEEEFQKAENEFQDVENGQVERAMQIQESLCVEKGQRRDVMSSACHSVRPALKMGGLVLDTKQ
jgi:uncharacterized cupin superfamily protein